MGYPPGFPQDDAPGAAQDPWRAFLASVTQGLGARAQVCAHNAPGRAYERVCARTRAYVPTRPRAGVGAGAPARLRARSTY